jgi:hypothetical protein
MFEYGFLKTKNNPCPKKLLRQRSTHRHLPAIRSLVFPLKCQCVFLWFYQFLRGDSYVRPKKVR